MSMAEACSAIKRAVCESTVPLEQVSQMIAEAALKVRS